MNISKVWLFRRHLIKSVFTRVAFVLLLFAIHGGCSDNAPQKYKKSNFKESGNYIQFKLGKEEFKIHKAYFQGGGESQFGVLYYAKFWALLPNFETYDKSKNRYEFVERLGWGRKLYFQMHLREKDRNAVAAIIERNKSKRGGFPFSGRLGSPDEMLYGLEVYRAINYGPDDYLYRPDGDTTIYITCGSEIMNVPSPHCEMKWDPSESVYADATFSKDYLPEWKTILSNIQQIFDGQVIEGV
jgi:hypothetical protein